MVKVISFVTRRGDMTHEECVKYHREIHTKLVSEVFGDRLKRYFAYYVDEAITHASIGPMQAERPCDIIVCTYFDDETWKNLGTFLETPEGRKIPEDEARFLDHAKLVSLVCQENVIK